MAVFLALLVVLAGASLVLLNESQERLAEASNRIQRALLPSSRLLEQARTELELQIQELVILHREGEVTAKDLARLRLTPAVKSLTVLQGNPLFPRLLLPLFKPWTELAGRYEREMPVMKSFAEAVPLLRELRNHTILLQRAVDRELTMQLLTVSKTGQEKLAAGTAALLLALLCSIAFVFLSRVWMAPLARITHWTRLNAADGSTSLAAAYPPPLPAAGGLLAPPAEVQDLSESVRALHHRIRNQSEEIENRAKKTAENERAVVTLLAAFQHLIRHNEELLAALLRKERLASMGEMAAQLAHEIRNPLNSLNLKLELLRESLAAPEQAQLDKVLTEIDRLDALTESHLRTTRALLDNQKPASAHDAETTERVDLVARDVIEACEPELHARGAEITLRTTGERLESPLPPNVLKAVLWNVLKNASEALEGLNGGRIEVLVDAESAPVRIRVRDTGCGFPAEWLEQEPRAFLTTKSAGSGLGLLTSRRMLAPYGYTLAIRSPADENYATEVTLTPLTGPESAARIPEVTL